MQVDGYTYFQRGRKCGKSSCRCANAQGEAGLHGPYWWRRKLHGGDGLEYVGKELPAEVRAAHEAHSQLAPEMRKKVAEFEQEIRRLQGYAEAIRTLIKQESLSKEQQQLVMAFGFAAALPRPPAAAQLVVSLGGALLCTQCQSPAEEGSFLCAACRGLL